MWSHDWPLNRLRTASPTDAQLSPSTKTDSMRQYNSPNVASTKAMRPTYLPILERLISLAGLSRRAPLIMRNTGTAQRVRGSCSSA